MEKAMEYHTTDLAATNPEWVAVTMAFAGEEVPAVSPLTNKEREMITFCFLMAQGGCENQLRGHTRGNLGVGNNKERLYAFVEQCVPYIGYPRSLNAMNIVDEVVAQTR